MAAPDNEFKYFAPGVGQILNQPRARRANTRRGEAHQPDAAQPPRAGGDQRGGAEARQHAPRTWPRTSSAMSPPASNRSERRAPTAAGAPGARRPGLQGLSHRRRRDARPARGQPGARPRRDDQPGRGVGQRQVDPDLAARRAAAARLGTDRLRRPGPHRPRRLGAGPASSQAHRGGAPERQPDPLSHRGGERRARDRARGRCWGRRRGTRGSSRRSASATASTTCLAECREARRSASRSRWPWPTSPTCCSRTR